MCHSFFVLHLYCKSIVLKVKHAMDSKQILKNKSALTLIVLGTFITIKCIIGVLFNTNNYNVYLDIATAHIIYWFVYFISIFIYKLSLKNKSSNL